MPLKLVTVRRGSIALSILFALAVGAVLATVFVWQFRPAGPAFAPLSFPDKLELADAAGDPPQLVSGQPLTFKPIASCLALERDLEVHVSVLVISTDQPPMQAVSLITGFPTILKHGCVSNRGLNLQPPVPLVPGLWRVVITISLVYEGKTQIISLLSAPFQVTPAAAPARTG